ncbi:hypothetical protein BgiBS90_029653, partial [Biomphalaria glabrata]
SFRNADHFFLCQRPAQQDHPDNTPNNGLHNRTIQTTHPTTACTTGPSRQHTQQRPAQQDHPDNTPNNGLHNRTIQTTHPTTACTTGPSRQHTQQRPASFVTPNAD